MKPQEAENIQNAEINIFIKNCNKVKILMKPDNFLKIASSNKGGVLNRFGSGQLSRKNLKILFQFNRKQLISKPFSLILVRYRKINQKISYKINRRIKI
jgi:hypothetical protein